MKKLLLCAGLAAGLVGCASDNEGGSADTYNYNTGRYEPGYGTPTGTSIAETNGPGMHSEKATGLPGPGTAGATNNWNGGPMP